MKNLIRGILFVSGFCLAYSVSDFPLFPVANIIGLGMIGIVLYSVRDQIY